MRRSSQVPQLTLDMFDVWLMPVHGPPSRPYTVHGSSFHFRYTATGASVVLQSRPAGPLGLAAAIGYENGNTHCAVCDGLWVSPEVC